MKRKLALLLFLWLGMVSLNEASAFTVTVVADPVEGGTVEGGGEYEYSSCWLTAVPNPGYSFMYWTENGVRVSADASYEIYVDHDREFVAHFALPFSISAVCHPAEGGTVDGVGEYDYRSICELTAIPNEGYTFFNWINSDGQLEYWYNPRAFYVDSDRLFEANFVRVELPLVQNFDDYTVGNKIAEEAAANGFDKWTTFSCTPGSNEDGVVDMLGDVQCAHFTNGNDQVLLLGNFETGAYTISFDMYIPEGKTAYNNILHSFFGNNSEWGAEIYYGSYIQAGGQRAYFDCPSNAWFNVKYEINLDLDMATFYIADVDILSWQFSRIQSGSLGAKKLGAINFFPPNGNSSEFYVDNFSLTESAATFQINAIANPSAGGTVKGSGSYAYGAECTMIAQPKLNYSFMYWTIDGEVVSTDDHYSFTVTGDRNLIANFSQPIAINAVCDPVEGGSIQGAGTYDYASECTLTATANDNYTFMYWTENGEIVSNEPELSFTVNTERNFVAHFALPFTISASASPQSYGAISGTGLYDYNTKCILSAIPNEGYAFVNWTEDGVPVSWSMNYIFTVTVDRNVVANFVEIGDDIEVLLTEPFEEYAVGNKVAVEALNAGHDWWTTWSNAPGSAEDAVVANNGGSQCAFISDAVDAVFLLGDHDRGEYNIEFDILIPEGSNGYFNALHHFAGTSSSWALQCYLHLYDDGDNSFEDPGHGMVHAGSNNTCSFTCLYDEWMHFCIHVNADLDLGELYCNGALLCQWQWSLDSFGNNTIDRNISAMNVFAPMSNSEFFVDNINFKRIGGETAPDFSINPSEVSLTLGEDEISSVDVTIDNIGSSIGEWYGWIEFGQGENGSQTASLSYYNGDYYEGIGSNTEASREMAIRLPESYYSGSAMGMRITSVDFFVGPSYKSIDDHYTFRLYAQNVLNQPGELLAETTLYYSDYNAWITATFDEDVYLTGQTIWATVELLQGANEYPMSIDHTDQGEEYDGNWLKTNNSRFTHCYSDGAFGGVWMINVNCEGTLVPNAWAILNKESGTLYAGESDAITLTLNSAGLDRGYYNANLVLMTTDVNHAQVEIPITLFAEGPTPVTQTLSLLSGTNWVSFNVETTLDDLKTALVNALPGATSINIRSQNDGYSTYNGTRWRGSLSAIDPTQMYMITVTSICDIALEGIAIDPAEHPITIKSGKNWITFPLSISMTLDEAFDGFTLINGDVIKSQNNGMATYNGTRWRGSLSTLVPGQGYIYSSTEERPLVFPASGK